MTLTIALPSERAAALAAIARAKGLTPEEYARQLLEQDLAPEWLRQSVAESRAGWPGPAFHGRDRCGNRYRTYGKRSSGGQVKLEKKDLNVIAD